MMSLKRIKFGFVDTLESCHGHLLSLFGLILDFRLLFNLLNFSII